MLGVFACATCNKMLQNSPLTFKLFTCQLLIKMLVVGLSLTEWWEWCAVAPASHAYLWSTDGINGQRECKHFGLHSRIL